MRFTTPRPGSSLLASLRSLTLTTTAAPARTFSTSSPLATKTISLQKLPAETVPPYPYGPRLLYKQSNNGLYGSARIRHGHNVSEAHGQITPRTWRPNVHRRRLWSDALGAWVRTRLTIRVLRTIRREGGIDAYVTKAKTARVRELGPGGWTLRWLISNTPAFRARYAAERERLGVKAPMPEDQTDLVHYMVDAATPGSLSATSKAILERRTAQMIAEEFAIGDDPELFEPGAQDEDAHAEWPKEPAPEKS
ncbi:ribosomal L28 family protein [Colletotrichum eremochloae]|nr:ribosomal L28 family protein [Colletotrichum eremochloae]